MSTFTGGPWTRNPGERLSHDNSAGVKGPDGLYLAAALDFNRYDRDDEVEANARLIAKSPEMFDLLRRAEVLLSRSKKIVEAQSSIPHVIETDLETLIVTIDDLINEISPINLGGQS